MWLKWLHYCFPNQVAKLAWSTHIDRVNLSYGNGKDFDEYVWGCGGHIRQEKGRRHLEFFNDEDATMFVLKWA